MRPLKGTILSINKKTGLKIRLESGFTGTLPYHKNMNIGQSILVKYDFTKNRIIGIINYYNEDNIPPPTKTNKGGDDNDPENPEIIENELELLSFL